MAWGEDPRAPKNIFKNWARAQIWVHIWAQAGPWVQIIRKPRMICSPARMNHPTLSTSLLNWNHHKAVLDMDTETDRLASGALAGSAGLRRQQLRGVGLKVHHES